MSPCSAFWLNQSANSFAAVVLRASSENRPFAHQSHGIWGRCYVVSKAMMKCYPSHQSERNAPRGKFAHLDIRIRYNLTSTLTVLADYVCQPLVEPGHISSSRVYFSSRTPHCMQHSPWSSLFRDNSHDDIGQRTKVDVAETKSVLHEESQPTVSTS